jgi:hypothetical protein
MKKTFIPTFLFILILTLLFSLVPVSAATTPVYSRNWTGCVATTSSSAPFTSVSATWTVPLVTGPNSSCSSVWVGIGGWYTNSSKLIQAGTEQDVDSNGNAIYSAWYEVYPKPPVTITTATVTVNPGDVISVSICQNTAKTWHITMTDTNTSTSTTLLNNDFKLNLNFASRATAEFIVERPLLVVRHQLATLADFNFVNFTGCSANNADLDSLDALQVFMTNDGSSGGTELAYPDAPSGSSFTVYYGAIAHG